MSSTHDNSSPLLPGESMTRLDDGTVVLTCRNGTTHTFAEEEWEEYNADFMDNLRTSDALELCLAKVSNRSLISGAEVVDMLLDLSTKVLNDQRVNAELVALWTRNGRRLEWFALHGVAPVDEMPDGWFPIWDQSDEIEQNAG